MIADRVDLSGLATADNPNSPLPSQTRLVIPEAVERQITDLFFFRGEGRKTGERGQSEESARVLDDGMAPREVPRAPTPTRARALFLSPPGLAGRAAPPAFQFLNGAGNVASPRQCFGQGWIEIDRKTKIQGGELGSARAGHGDGDEERGTVGTGLIDRGPAREDDQR